MFTYSVYNIRLISNIELPLLENTNSKYQLHSFDIYLDVKHALSEDSKQNFYSRDLTYFKNPSIGSFEISNGNNIKAFIHNDVNIDEFTKFILYSGVPICLFQRNYMVFHASSILYKNKSLVFIGQSGYGKSSIASLFLNNGNNLLAEDRTIIHFKESKPMIVPSLIPLIKINKKAIKFKSKLKRYNILPDEIQRTCYRIDTNTYSFNNHEIDAIVFLGWGNKNSIVKINSQKKIFSEIYRNSIKPSKNADQASHINYQENTALLLTGDIKYFEYMRVKKNSFKTDQVLKEIENIYNLV